MPSSAATLCIVGLPGAHTHTLASSILSPGDMVCQGPGSSSTGVFDDEVRPLLKGMVEGSEEEKNACVISFGKSNEIGELVELPEGGGQGEDS